MDGLQLAIGHLDLTRGHLETTEGEPRELSLQECALLAYLARRPHQDVSREALLTEVLGYTAGVVSRAIDDAMKRLRAKVERVPSRPFHLVGVRGVGYRFVPLETAPDRRRFRVGARTVDLDRLIVEAPGEEALSLSSNEARLLELLRDREGRPMATVDLLREVWGVRDPEQRRVVDRLVYRLRAKVEDAPKSPRYLRTIRGRGLALVVEDANAAGTTSSMGTPCPVPDVEVLGRDGLIQATLDALAAPGALITLHGPAGAGKSTASQAIAQGWAGPSRYADLEPTTSASAVLLAIARALGADDAPDAPEGRVHAALRDSEDLLLVLDHAEVALASVAEVVDAARRAAPEARILVASRHPLGVSGEVITPVAALSEEAAIALFVSRARAAGITVDVADPRVGQIVNEVDRIPLALDLAAGRLRILSLDSLVSHLDRPLDLLQHANTHDGLRQSLARTWDAISDDDQQLLAACSTFSGPFLPEAAERVCAPVTSGQVLDGLQRLVDFALLKRTAEGQLVPFLGVKELVSEALGDRLAALTPRLQEAHLDWLADLSNEVVPYWGPLPEHMARLRAEVPGAMAALERTDDVVKHAQILVWLAPVLTTQGMTRQAQAMLRRVSDTAALPAKVRTRFSLTELRVMNSRGKHITEELATRLLAQARSDGDLDTECVALGEYLRRAVDTTPQDELVAYLEQAHDLIDQVPSPRAEAQLRSGIGMVAFRNGDLDTAWAELQESSALARLANSPWQESRNSYNLAGLCRFEGRLAEAEAFLEQSRAAYHAARVPVLRNDPDDMLGLIRLEQGRLTEAEALHRGILDRARRTGNRTTAAMQANRLGTLAGYRGELAAAKRWFEQARTHFEAEKDTARAEAARFNLGHTSLLAGDLEEARVAFEYALASFLALGRENHAGICEGGLARIALAHGDAAAAEAHATSGLARLEAGRARRMAEEVRGVLAEARAVHDPAAAQELAQEAVTALEEIGESPALGCTWCRLGRVALQAGDRATAERAASRAAELAEALGVRSGSELGQELTRLREALSH